MSQQEIHLANLHGRFYVPREPAPLLGELGGSHLRKKFGWRYSYLKLESGEVMFRHPAGIGDNSVTLEEGITQFTRYSSLGQKMLDIGQTEDLVFDDLVASNTLTLMGIWTVQKIVNQADERVAELLRATRVGTTAPPPPVLPQLPSSYAGSTAADSTSEDDDDSNEQKPPARKAAVVATITPASSKKRKGVPNMKLTEIFHATVWIALQQLGWTYQQRKFYVPPGKSPTSEARNRHCFTSQNALVEHARLKLASHNPNLAHSLRWYDVCRASKETAYKQGMMLFDYVLEQDPSLAPRPDSEQFLVRMENTAQVKDTPLPAAPSIIAPSTIKKTKKPRVSIAQAADMDIMMETVWKPLKKLGWKHHPGSQRAFVPPGGLNRSGKGCLQSVDKLLEKVRKDLATNNPVIAHALRWYDATVEVKYSSKGGEPVSRLFGQVESMAAAPSPRPDSDGFRRMLDKLQLEPFSTTTVETKKPAPVYNNNNNMETMASPEEDSSVTRAEETGGVRTSPRRRVGPISSGTRHASVRRGSDASDAGGPSDRELQVSSMDIMFETLWLPLNKIGWAYNPSSDRRAFIPPGMPAQSGKGCLGSLKKLLKKIREDYVLSSNDVVDHALCWYDACVEMRNTTEEEIPKDQPVTWLMDQVEKALAAPYPRPDSDAFRRMVDGLRIVAPPAVSARPQTTTMRTTQTAKKKVAPARVSDAPPPLGARAANNNARHDDLSPIYKNPAYAEMDVKDWLNMLLGGLLVGETIKQYAEKFVEDGYDTMRMIDERFLRFDDHKKWNVLKRLGWKNAHVEVFLDAMSRNRK